MTTQTFAHTIGKQAYTGRIAHSNTGKSAKPVIFAIHGGTYDSVYFDVPGHSLMDRASAAGFDIVAIDRPGYGESTALPDAPDLIQKNAEALNAGLPALLAALDLSGRPVFVIGHSIGGATALTLVALAKGWKPSGVAVSGVGAETPPDDAGNYAHLPQQYFVELPTPMKDVVMFGPAGTCSAEMPGASHLANRHVPRSELTDITGGWKTRLATVAPAIQVPVHYRQGEYEKLWLNSAERIDAFGKLFVNCPKVDAAMTMSAGHCIDFHIVGANFQQSQLDFAAATTKG